MTPIPTRPEDLLREMRTAIVPVDDSGTVDGRRARTVARLRELQVRAGTRREVEVSYRKRLLIAAAVLLFSAGALAAAIQTWDRPLPPKTAPRETTAATPRTAVGTTTSPVDSPRTPDDAAEVAALPGLEPERLSTPAHTTRAHEKTAAKSTLAAENALMQSALAAGRAGDDERAATLLESLLTRYPESPLAQSAEVERFRALKRLGDLRKASEEARRYLGEHPEGMAQDEARRLAIEPPSSPRTRPGSR